MNWFFAFLLCLQYVSTSQRFSIRDEKCVAFFVEELTFSKNFENNRIYNPIFAKIFFICIFGQNLMLCAFKTVSICHLWRHIRDTDIFRPPPKQGIRPICRIVCDTCYEKAIIFDTSLPYLHFLFL